MTGPEEELIENTERLLSGEWREVPFEGSATGMALLKPSFSDGCMYLAFTPKFSVTYISPDVTFDET